MEKYLSEKYLKNLIPSCCKIGFASINDYNEIEISSLTSFLPGTKTIIVLFHHIQNSLEWLWYPFENERGEKTCGADQHSQIVLNKLKNYLQKEGYNISVLPYPDICGVMFKTIATKTCLGELGENFLFMNNEWGPWIHLRVLLTNAEFSFERIELIKACNHCGNCRKVCPADAIKSNSFDGIKCRESMHKRSEELGKKPFVFECEICLRSCPIGTIPEEVIIDYKR